MKKARLKIPLSQYPIPSDGQKIISQEEYRSRESVYNNSAIFPASNKMQCSENMS